MKNIACPLQKNSEKQGSQPALMSGDTILTYREFHQLVSQTQNKLKNLGLGPGKRVALFLPNSIEAMILLYALWRIKAVAFLVNTYLPAKAIKNQLATINARFVISSSQINIKNIKSIALRSIIPHLKVDELPAQKKYNFPINQNVSILFTSGTSGAPKAALHSFGNYYYNALGANRHIPFKRNDRWLLTLPLYHVGGLSVIFRAFLGGGCIVIGDKNVPAQIKRFKPTHISVVPAQLKRWLNQKGAGALRKCKCILIGGAPIPKRLIEEGLAKKLAFYGTYGLTEMSSQVATTNKITKPSKELNAKILPFVQVKISKGEICVKGPTLFKGYIQKNRIDRSVDKNGWFKTGDLGVLKNGSLIIQGRADAMFISGGENIQPEEIEKRLLDIRDIQSACVISKEDGRFGRRPVAFIKTAHSKKATKSAIVRQLVKTLPKFKIPEEWYCLPKKFGARSLKTSRWEVQRIYDRKKGLERID